MSLRMFIDGVSRHLGIAESTATAAARVVLRRVSAHAQPNDIEALYLKLPGVSELTAGGDPREITGLDLETALKLRGLNRARAQTFCSVFTLWILRHLGTRTTIGLLSRVPDPTHLTEWNRLPTSSGATPPERRSVSMR